MKKRIISLICALILCCSFLVGCGKEEYTGIRTFEGTHVLTAPELEDYIVQDGKTDYRILVPANFDAHTKMAYTELQTFFKQATGINLVVDFETGEGLTHNPNLKYISIGQTKLLQSANLNGDDNTENDYDLVKLTKDGVRIVTKDKTVYIFGGKSQGDVNGVYDFLQIMFDYEYYYHNCWEINEGVLNAKLRDFNVTDIPDYKHRNSGWSAVSNAYDNMAYRMRASLTESMVGVGDLENGFGRVTFHNTSEILPPSAPTTEGEWLSDNGDQLCYTAHGDPDSYERMVERTVKVVIDSLKAAKVGNKPDVQFFTISHEDNGAICSCTACVREKEKYGAASGSVIKFLNNVMILLHEKMDQAVAENPEEAKIWVRKDLHCLYFAYGSFVKAPNATYDEDLGKFVVDDEEVAFHPNVGAYFAINNINYYRNIYDPINDSSRKNIEITYDIASLIALWTYEVNFANYLEPVNSFNFFTNDGFQFLASCHPEFIYNQANFNKPGLTSFQTLKVYLASKCFWDSSLDTEELTAKYFEAMFGEAKELMIDLWNHERNYDDMLIDSTGIGYSFLRSTNRPEYWPPHTLIKWMSYCERAFELIEKVYKNSDPERYESIKYHIEQEYVMPCYYLAYYHKKEVIGQKWIDAAKFLKYASSAHLTYCLGQSGVSLNADWATLKV